MSSWIQVKFEKVDWYVEGVTKSPSLTAEPPAKYEAMISGFMKTKLTGDLKPIGELLTCLVKAKKITSIHTIGRSMFLGPGSKKCSFLLPKSIVIPTSLKLPVGSTDVPPMHQEIKVSGDRFYMTIRMTIKAAFMSDSEAHLLYEARPKEFIGFIDCDCIPEGSLTKTASDGTKS